MAAKRPLGDLLWSKIPPKGELAARDYPEYVVEFNNYNITGDNTMPLTTFLHGAPPLFPMLLYKSGVISGRCDLLNDVGSFDLKEL